MSIDRRSAMVSNSLNIRPFFLEDVYGGTVVGSEFRVYLADSKLSSIRASVYVRLQSPQGGYESRNLVEKRF